jgi:hypothetical protein
MKVLQVGFEHCEWVERSGFDGPEVALGFVVSSTGLHLCATVERWSRQKNLSLLALCKSAKDVNLLLASGTWKW